MSGKRVDESPEPEIGLQPARKKQALASSAQVRADDPLLELNIETAELKAKMQKVEEELKETKAEKKKVEQTSNEHQDKLQKHRLSDDQRKFHLQRLKYLEQKEHDLAQKEHDLAQEKHDLAKKELALLKLRENVGKCEAVPIDKNDLYAKIVNCDVTNINSLVKLQDDWPCALKSEPLFVRKCYPDMYDKAKQQHEAGAPGIIYTGNPGIGKSAWLNYALVRFLQEDYSVVLERAAFQDFLLFQDHTCMKYTGRASLSHTLELLPKRSVYLFDPDENDTAPLDTDMVFTIVSTSPQVKHYKRLGKKVWNGLCAPKLYFPCWSLEELLSCAPEINPSQVEEMFCLWGGIPRYVYLDDDSKFKATLHSYVNRIDLSLIEAYLNTNEIAECDQDKLSHMVVQYVVTDSTYERGELDFASPFIGQLVVTRLSQTRYNELIKHYDTLRHAELQGPYRGHLWQHLCHLILPRGCKGGFELEPLKNAKQQQSSRRKRIIKTAVEVKSGDLRDIKDALREGNYFRPYASNFKAIDAAVMDGNDVFGLNMTIASTHAICVSGVKDLMEALPADAKLHFVWVVDRASEKQISSAQRFSQPKNPRKHMNEKSLKGKISQWTLKMSFPKKAPFDLQSRIFENSKIAEH